MSLIGLLNYFDQRSGREQYGNLLNEYKVGPVDPQEAPATPWAAGQPEFNQALNYQKHGGFRGEGGVLSGGPPQEFYVRAAALPGYQQLAQQAQQGQIQMQLQQQNQQWQQENLTAGQKATLEANRFTEEMRYTRPTYYEAAQLSIRREELDQQDWARRQSVAQGWAGNAIRKDEFNANYMPDPNNPKGFVPRPAPLPTQKPQPGYVRQPDPASPVGFRDVPIPGTDDWRKGQVELSTLQSGLEGAKALSQHFKDYGTTELWNRPAAARAEVQRQKVITGLGTLSNMGVLQPGDLDRLTKQLADPTDWGPGAMVGMSRNAIAATEEVGQRLAEAYKATSARFSGNAPSVGSTKKTFKYNPETGKVE